MADRQTMDVSEALALAAQYRTAYAGAMRKPAFVRALLALADRVVDRVAEAAADPACHFCGHPKSRHDAAITLASLPCATFAPEGR